MIICLLGRQPDLSLVELKSIYSQKAVKKIGDNFALIDISSDDFNILRLGGVQKAGIVLSKFNNTDWSDVTHKLGSYYCDKYASHEGKITLGISAWGFKNVGPRQITDFGLRLKRKLKVRGTSLRIIPTKHANLSTATSHHNKLGLSDNKKELLIIKNGNSIIVAESIGAQNISAYAKRDQARPARDTFVGMLPPKLAQIMLNLAIGDRIKKTEATQIILDPFCGTGVVLQESLLMGYTVYGSDLSQKMVDYTKENLTWLENTHKNHPLGQTKTISQKDATKATWQYASRLNAVVCEGYLGQPFNKFPSTDKLKQVQGNCSHIANEFLSNISSQITAGTRVCLAVPAWRDSNTIHYTKISQPKDLAKLPYGKLLYYRENQVVARDILVFEKR